MKKRIILTVLGMALVCIIIAQQHAPAIVSPGGGIDQSQSISLEWTIGESLTETVYTDRLMLTQGFHQPLLTVIKLPDGLSSTVDLGFQIFPNPVESILEVKMPENFQKDVELILYDIEGKLIMNLPIKKGKQSKQIDMSQFPTGTYLLRCVVDDETKYSSFKIIKS